MIHSMHYKTKQGNMAYYYDILNSSDDEDIVQMINRRPKVFKPRRNYFEELDDIEFKKKHFFCFCKIRCSFFS